MVQKKRDYKKDFPCLISRLENMIIVGAFLPKERLVEAALAERMGVSRAWIRDALKILETKGLVKMVPYRGAMVTDLSEQEVNEIFQVRVVLERLCNQLAAENFTEEDGGFLTEIAQEIESACGDNAINEMINANTRFHDHILDMSRNTYLIETLKQVRSRYYIFNTFAWSSPDIITRVQSEHRQFIAALETKDYDLLNTLAEKHISYSKDMYLNQIKRRSI